METTFAKSTRRKNITRVEPPLPPADAAAAPHDIPELVSRGWKLDAEIALLYERLAAIKTQLIDHARKGNRKLQTVELQGVEVGHKATISFPDDRLVPGFYLADNGDAIAYIGDEKTNLGKLKERCGEKHFDALFHTYYKPHKRDLLTRLATALLGETRAQSLLQKISTPSSPRVSFKSK